MAEQQDAFVEVATALGRERSKSAQLENSLAEVLSSNSWREKPRLRG